ncbi:hypothetical protein Taro_034871 [Colocasia esculenta]|uniref:Uncharacterized protein n=1 Tax=Colocasia esculenta TaxID=4460 RepID=A0A843W543_COLES|nr:hypothetical protein [Colocasia esculenta]
MAAAALRATENNVDSRRRKAADAGAAQEGESEFEVEELREIMDSSRGSQFVLLTRELRLCGSGMDGFRSRCSRTFIIHPENRQWQAMVGVVPRLGRTSRGVRRGVSSRPQHPRVLRYSLHHHLWTMACSCKAWSRQYRLRLRPRLRCRLTCRLRLRLQLQFPRSMAMVVHPSWRGLRGWLRLLLRGRVSPFCQRVG